MVKERDESRGFQLVDDEKAEGATQHEGPETLPPITFAAFVLSLSTSALMHLGGAPLRGLEQKAETDLPLAKQSIDILSMIHEKTQGNLEGDEQQLLESVLHDLRMRYVEACKPKP